VQKAVSSNCTSHGWPAPRLADAILKMDKSMPSHSLPPQSRCPKEQRSAAPRRVCRSCTASPTLSLLPSPEPRQARGRRLPAPCQWGKARRPCGKAPPPMGEGAPSPAPALHFGITRGSHMRLVRSMRMMVMIPHHHAAPSCPMPAYSSPLIAAAAHNPISNIQ